MFSRKLITISAIAVNLWAWAPAASSGSLSQVEGRAAYQLIQNVSSEFGSKSMSGYFLLVHSWYDESAATARTVIRSRVKKSRKSATAGFGATWRPNNATGLRTIA